MLEFVQPDTGNAFGLVTSEADLTGYGEAIGVVIGTDFEVPWPQLAGVGGDGSILVLEADADVQATDVLHVDDPVTRCGRRRPTSDCRDGRTAAWIADGHVMWIDCDQRLGVDGERVVVRYTRVRAA